MDLSVVVPTLNGRDQLEASLDALASVAPDAELVVVNGPSADGTTGMVRDRDDVDALVEIADRNVNAARNAGIAAATGDRVAVLRFDRAVDGSWLDALREGFADGADVVTGPTRSSLDGEEGQVDAVAGREVVHCNGENVAFSREAVEALDGFDEYLEVGGARDVSHRLEGLGFDVAWEPSMSVSGLYGADGGATGQDRRQRYRSLSYQLVKNYGPHPAVALRSLRDAGADAVGAARDVLAGDGDVTGWFGDGRDAVAGLLRGAVDGLRARRRDRSRRRNPNGISARADRAVQRYDWR